jgi:hypothetical protein
MHSIAAVDVGIRRKTREDGPDVDDASTKALSLGVHDLVTFETDDRDGVKSRIVLLEIRLALVMV